MKVRMDPGSVRIRDVGAKIVGIVPAPGAGQPERAQLVGDPLRGLVVIAGGLIQFGSRHGPAAKRRIALVKSAGWC